MVFTGTLKPLNVTETIKRYFIYMIVAEQLKKRSQLTLLIIFSRYIIDNSRRK